MEVTFTKDQERAIKSLPYDPREWSRVDPDTKSSGFYVRKKDNTVFLLSDDEIKSWRPEQRAAMDFLWKIEHPDPMALQLVAMSKRRQEEQEARRKEVQKTISDNIQVKKHSKAYKVYYCIWWILKFFRLLIFGKQEVCIDLITAHKTGKNYRRQSWGNTNGWMRYAETPGSTISLDNALATDWEVEPLSFWFKGTLRQFNETFNRVPQLLSMMFAVKKDACIPNFTTNKTYNITMQECP